MYTIKVITTAGEKALDMIASSFPYNFEANDVAELTDRSASWSYTIKLPRTPNNESILGMAGLPYVNASTPYTRIPCNVYANGILIIHRGVLVIDKTHNDTYDIQILSGIAGVFELMKDINFETWSDKTTITLPTNTYPATTRAAGERYVYTTGNPVANIGGIYANTKDWDFYKYAYPLAFVGAPTTSGGLLKRVLDQIGYTMVTNTNTTIMDKLYLSMVKRPKIGSTSVLWSSPTAQMVYTGGAYNTITNQGRTSMGITRLKATIRIKSTFYDSHHSLISPYTAFTNFNQAGGAFTVGFIDASGSTAFHSLNIGTCPHAIVSTSEEDIYITVDLPNSTDHNGVKAFYSYMGNTQWNYYDGSQITTHTGIGLTTSACKFQLQTIDASNSSDAICGQQMLLEANTGLKNAEEFFKLLCQIYGWTVSIDAKNHIIYAYTFQKIAWDKANAKDWTNKMAMDQDRDVDFEFGSYGQRNYISLEENKITAYIDRAYFDIANTNLEVEKTIASIKASSGTGSTIEQWQRQEDGSVKWTNTSSPHLVTYDGSTIGHYTAATIKTNYQLLILAMQDTQVLTAKFHLTPIDILQFSPFVPIFLKQYGHYYYVNKIKSWEDGKLCDVELVKIAG